MSRSVSMTIPRVRGRRSSRDDGWICCFKRADARFAVQHPAHPRVLNRDRPTPDLSVCGGFEDSPLPDRLVHLTFSLFALITVALLNLTDQLIAPSGQLIQFIVSELAPLLLSATFELFPVPFDLIPIHHIRPFSLSFPNRY